MKSPAFQIYPADFLADANTLVMSAAEVGAYWLLLCVCWRENGLPDDVEELAAIARTHPKQFQNSWDRRIKRCFILRDDGKWTHNRLQKERDKQTENREKRQSAGAKGAAERWQTDSNANPESSQGHESANGKTMASDGLSSSSSISSSVTNSTTKEKKGKRADKPHDLRSKHPAIVAVQEVRGRYPNKDVWDLVIKTLGDTPDVDRLRECWVAWRTKNYAPENLGWLVDWYVNGMSGGSNGTNRRETASERNVRNIKESLAYIDSLPPDGESPVIESEARLLTPGARR